MGTGWGMDLEQDSASHPFLAWTQVLARTQTSPLPFLTHLLGVLYSIAQTFTSSEAAQLYLHHFLKARKKIRGRNRLARQNVPLLISVKREAAVQKSLPLCTLTSARDHPASILCRDTDGYLLYSWIFILGLSRAWKRVTGCAWDKQLEVILSSGVSSSFQVCLCALVSSAGSNC